MDDTQQPYQMVSAKAINAIDGMYSELLDALARRNYDNFSYQMNGNTTVFIDKDYEPVRVRVHPSIANGNNVVPVTELREKQPAQALAGDLHGMLRGLMQPMWDVVDVPKLPHAAQWRVRNYDKAHRAYQQGVKELTAFLEDHGVLGEGVYYEMLDDLRALAARHVKGADKQQFDALDNKLKQLAVNEEEKLNALKATLEQLETIPLAITDQNGVRHACTIGARDSYDRHTLVEILASSQHSQGQLSTLARGIKVDDVTTSGIYFRHNSLMSILDETPGAEGVAQALDTQMYRRIVQGMERILKTYEPLFRGVDEPPKLWKKFDTALDALRKIDPVQYDAAREALPAERAAKKTRPAAARGLESETRIGGGGGCPYHAMLERLGITPKTSGGHEL